VTVTDELPAKIQALPDSGFGLAGSSAAAASPEELLAALRELEPQVKSRKPKPIKAAMEQVDALAVPDRFAAEMVDLGKLIGRYKFGEALVVLGALMDRLE
jgi:hypothetical protein